MPRGKKNAAHASNGIGDLTEVTSAINDVVIALGDLEKPKAMLALETVVRLMSADERPPVLAPVRQVSGIDELRAKASELGLEIVEPCRAEPRALPAPKVTARRDLIDQEDDDDGPEVARLERAIKLSAGRKSGGRKRQQQTLDETVAFIRSRGVVSKGDVAWHFKISDSGAYQRLNACMRAKLVNHSGENEYRLIDAPRKRTSEREESANRLTESRQKTLGVVKAKGEAQASDLMSAFGISREAAGMRLQGLARLHLAEQVPGKRGYWRAVA